MCQMCLQIQSIVSFSFTLKSVIRKNAVNNRIDTIKFKLNGFFSLNLLAMQSESEAFQFRIAHKARLNCVNVKKVELYVNQVA